MQARSLTHTLALAVALLAIAVTPAAAATVRETIDRTFEVEPGSQVRLSNTNGSVTVGSWDRPEVRMVATKKVQASSDERGRELLEEIRIEISQTAGALVIETERPRSSAFGWLSGRGDTSVSYELTVPREMDLDVTTVNGTVEAKGVRGDLSFRSTNGRIEIAEAAGSVEAHTTNGGISVELTEVDPSSAMRFSTTNGSIKAYLPATLRADLRASTTNGSISSDLPIEIRGTVSRKRMEGSINGGGAELRLSTTNGSISIREL